MKKVNKYLIFIVLLLFVMIGKVSADSETMKIELSTSGDNTATVHNINFGSHKGVTCAVGYGTSGGTELFINAEGGYSVQTIADSAIKSGTDFYSCEYTSAPGKPYSEDKTYNIVVEVKFGFNVVDTKHNITLVKGYAPSNNLHDKLNRATNIISAEVTRGNTADGTGIVNLDCSSVSNCVVSINDAEVPNDNSKRIATVVVTYSTSINNNPVRAVFNIDVISYLKVTAYPGDYGECKFDSSWESYGAAYEKEVKGGSISLPNCGTDNSANPFIKFEGWVATSDHVNETPDLMHSDTCKNYGPKTGTFNVSNDPSLNVYVACYSSDTGIVLMPNGGKVKMASNYVDMDGNIFVKGSGNITLPPITEIPSLYNMYGTGKFVGWSDTAGIIHNAGTSVPADGGMYIATYTSSSLINGAESNQKMVYVNETSAYASSYGDIRSCSSTDTSKLTANISGGECMLTGVESSGDDYIDVTITMDDGTTSVLKVRVVSKDGVFGDDWQDVIIDKDDNVDFNDHNGTFDTVAGAEICTKFKVRSDYVVIKAFAKYKNNLNVTQYVAKSKCAEDGYKEYMALCMDPGRYGPSDWINYVYDDSFNKESEFGMLVTHIVKQFANQNETAEDIAAANVALRIVEYYSPDNLAAATGNVYTNSLNAYKAVGASLNSACPDLASCTSSQVYNALGVWTWNNDTVRQKVSDIISGFDRNTSDGEIKNESKRSSSFDNSNEMLYHITYEGTLTLPAGMNVDPAKDIKPDCGTIPGVKNCQLTGNLNGSVYTYKFTYDVDLSNLGFEIPTNTDSRNPGILVTASAGVTNANVFILKSDDATTYQRMVIFNTEPVNLKSLMPVYIICDITKEPFKVGSAGFRQDLFMKAGCCQFITNEKSQEYIDYCTVDCVQTNFATMCDPFNVVGGGTVADVYSINESYKINKTGKELDYACIVDTKGGSSAVSNTTKLHDAVGNLYSIIAYNGNPYCTISCKEDWEISTASFKNFIGTNAIAAGQSFAITNPLFIGGSRTCVTTYLDYAKYQTDLEGFSKKIVDAWNVQSEYTKVYSVLNASGSSKVETYYHWQVRNTYLAHDGNRDGSGQDGEGSCSADGMAEYHYDPYDCRCVKTCSGEGEDKTCDTSCDTCYRKVCDKANPCSHTRYVWEHDGGHSCTVYKITSSAGGSFDKDIGTIQNPTKGTGWIGTSSLNNFGGTHGGGVEIHTAWEVDKGTPPDTVSNASSYDGYCKQEQDHEYLMDVVGYSGSNVKDRIESERKIINDNRYNVYLRAHQFTKCQNFQLKNTTTEAVNAYNYDNEPVDKAYGGTIPVTKFLSTLSNQLIETKFEPSASYTYEEREFMNLIGNKNYIEPYIEYNEEKSGQTTDAFNGQCVIIPDRKNDKGENVKLCKNHLVTYAYNPAGPWRDKTYEQKNYEDGTQALLKSVSLATFKITLCSYSGSYDYSTIIDSADGKSAVVSVDFNSSYEYDSHGVCSKDWGEASIVSYYPVHYIKQTISNSSFYKNWGLWVQNTANDVKAHAKDYNAGVTKLKVDESFVTLFGHKFNTFPISMTTPRNIYQYSYTFANIGYFSDGTPGRIMGKANQSLIAINKHACFYEVFEDICRCCGDPILWETFDTSMTGPTQDYFDDVGYDYEQSDTSYNPSKPLNSQLGFVNSTVGLNDINTSNDRPLAGNWSSKDLFTYQYNKYTTDKGDVLANFISDKGETIYNTSANNSPEYSYTLGPDAISLIREYNDGHTYGYSAADLIPYGISASKTPFDNSITAITAANKSSVNTFSHFGSKFLEKYMNSYITKSFKNDVLVTRTSPGSSTVCSVSGGANAAKKAYELVQSGSCRWVDYIQHTSDGNYIRLAFK